MQRVAPYIAIAALLLVVFLMQRTGRLEDQVKTLRAAAPAIANISRTAAPVEVAQNMGRIQTYAHKLWFAGQAGDAALVEFYRHEMKEEMEAIADAGVVDDGVPVSEHMKVYGIRTLDAFKAHLKAEGLKDFNDQYATLLAACNSCHATSGHPELRMRIPETNRYTDQEFGTMR